jgi:hypothetical protein
MNTDCVTTLAAKLNEDSCIPELMLIFFLVQIRVIRFEVQLRIRKSFVDVTIMQLFVTHFPLATKCR